MNMVHDIFDSYRDENNTDGINKSTDAKDIIRSNSYNLDESESNVTRAIRASIERNSHVNMKNSETSFKQVLDLAMNVVNELPTMVNVTGKTINKMIVKGKEGIESINNFKNSMSYSCKDRS
jgi:macrodomain Ter protein organizer (MatP/YcbG family)